MSVLSDVSLRAQLETGRLVVDPLAEDAIQPSSIDLRIGDELLVFHASALVDPERGERPEPTRQAIEGAYFLFPNQFVLAATREHVEVPDDLVGVLTGKSSLARDGLQVEAAGYVDPGWKGRLTVELKNLGPLTIVLRRGMWICQIRFERLTTPCERPYGSTGLGSHYQESEGPVASRLHVPAQGGAP